MKVSHLMIKMVKDLEKITPPKFRHVILNEVKNLSVDLGDSSLRRLRSE